MVRLKTATSALSGSFTAGSVVTRCTVVEFLWVLDRGVNGSRCLQSGGHRKEAIYANQPIERSVQLQQTAISPLRLVESQRALLVDGHRDLGTGYRESTVAEFL